MTSELKENRSFDLLDIAVVAAENWKSLIIIPIFFGILVFSIIKFADPRSYQSDAVLKITTEEVALLKSARVLDPVLKDSGLLTENDNSYTRARARLLEELKIVKVEDAPYYALTLTATDASEAQSVLAKIIGELIKQSVPAGELRKEIEQDIAAKQDAIATLKNSLVELTSALKRPASTESGGSSADVGQSVVALVSSLEAKRQEVTKARLLLNGTVSADDVIQPATSPDSAVSGRQVLVAMLSVLMAGFVVFGIALLKEVLGRAANDEYNSRRVDRIRTAFYFGKRKMDIQSAQH